MTEIKKVPRRKPLTANIAVFAVGYDVYWGQFEGLYGELDRKRKTFCESLRRRGVRVSDFGMIDNAARACELIPKLKAADPDLIFVDMVTYATSSTIGAVFREMNVPIVLAVLQPLSAMDYERGTTYMQLCNDDLCSVPEFTGVAIRMGRPAPEVIIGKLHGDPAVERELDRWCAVARVLHDLRRARIGHLGHVLEAMLDMHTDPTAVTAAFGPHVVQCEAAEIEAYYADVPAPELDGKKREILDFFDTPDPVSDPVTVKLTECVLEIGARAAVALEKFIDAKNLDGLAYYFEAAPGSRTRELVTNLIVGNSLLTGAGFPMCGEYDIKTCIAMLIMDRLDIGGSFAEFHPIDFDRNTVLVGHDGPHHINIADRKPVLRSLRKYHGKPGHGASVEFNIKKGPITMLSIGVAASGRFKFVIAEGESLEGPIPPTGNTNTHGRFGSDIRRFLADWVREGPTHHFALGIGHHAETIAQIARILNVEYAVVRHD